MGSHHLSLDVYRCHTRSSRTARRPRSGGARWSSGPHRPTRPTRSCRPGWSCRPRWPRGSRRTARAGGPRRSWRLSLWRRISWQLNRNEQYELDSSPADKRQFSVCRLQYCRWRHPYRAKWNRHSVQWHLYQRREPDRRLRRASECLVRQS